jgi:hypothetical protein
MRFGMVFRRRFGVLDGMQFVPVRNMRVMAGGNVIARFVVLGCLAMVMSRMIEVFGGLVMMMMCRMLFAHWFTPS